MVVRIASGMLFSVDWSEGRNVLVVPLDNNNCKSVAAGAARVMTLLLLISVFTAVIFKLLLL
jgi:hypothetical protein